MNTTTPNLRFARLSLSAGLACAGAILLLGAASTRLAAQSADFNSGTDTGWTHYALPYYGTPTYSFPADDTGGLAYKMYAPPTGSDAYGLRNSRVGSLRPDALYSGRFSVATDLLQWNAVWRQESGLLFFLQDVGLGTTDGYVATYSSGYQQLYISQITDEAPTTIAEIGTGTIILDPTHKYRLVVSSHDGSTYLFQLFDKAQPNSPWASAIGQDSTYSAGVCGLFVFEQTYPSDTQGAEATFDNYLAATPAANSLPTTITDLNPPPAGKTTEFFPVITVGILDRDTTVDTSSIALALDGNWISSNSLTIDNQVHKLKNPSSGVRDFAGATVTYTIPTLLPWGSLHTNMIAYTDSSSVRRTNTWSWTIAYPYLFASNSLPVGSLKVRGFDTRMVQADNGGTQLDNSLTRALQQLAIPSSITNDRSATSIVQVLNWNKQSDPPNNVPGLCSGTYINIAVQSEAYLELTAGFHRFHVKTDDSAGFYSGVNLADTNAVTLWEKATTTADTTFDFAVEATGLYPLRAIWQETAGSAVLSLYSVNTNDASEVLINDSTDPAGVVKAWYPLACRSAASAAGPFTVDATAANVLNTVDLLGADCSQAVVGQAVTSGKFTVPVSGSARFYRLDGPRATQITGIQPVGSNIEITYQVK